VLIFWSNSSHISYLYSQSRYCTTAMVTRKNDQSWSDTVNWVLRSLIQAELANITSSNAEEFMDTSYASSSTKLDVISSIKAVGNYGDVYNRHMQDVVPRKGLNLLYDTSVENQVSGLQYSHPFGTIDASRHAFSQDGKINTILNRGKLVCGVIGDTTQSIESDYCRAISASLFSSDTSLVDIVKLTNDDDLLRKLDSGEVDVKRERALSFRTISSLQIRPLQDSQAWHSHNRIFTCHLHHQGQWQQVNLTWTGHILCIGS